MTLETKIPPRPENVQERPDVKIIKQKITQVDKKMKKSYDEKEVLYTQL